MATVFVDWLIRPDGGQRIIKTFAVNGHILYTPAPSDDKLTALSTV
jgi:ABC-type tungstate transport system permease subunit